MRPADDDPKIANSVHKIAKLHNFSKENEKKLERIIQEHALVMADTGIGQARNALFPSHSESVVDEFKSFWRPQASSNKWIRTSIRKVLSGHIHQINRAKGTTKKINLSASKAKKEAKSIQIPQDTLNNPSLNGSAEMAEDIAGLPSSRADVYGTQQRFASIQPIMESVESPVMTWEATHSTLGKRPTPSTASESMRISLADIIVVVRPSTSDLWRRKIVSFPLWRCQSPIDGRDAPPDSLSDWRDLSFADFIRQLRTERAINDGEVVQWGEYDQVITSDVSFAGAVQEQLQGAQENGTAFNEATFMVAPLQAAE